MHESPVLILTHNILQNFSLFAQKDSAQKGLLMKNFHCFDRAEVLKVNLGNKMHHKIIVR